MKLDKKGFMLAEVVVVSVVIAVALIGLYTGINNVSSAYETRNRYYDVDSLYVAMEINDILRKNVSLVDFTSLKADEFVNWSTSIDTTFGSSVLSFIDFYYDKIGDSVFVYICSYDESDMLLLKNFNSNLTFSEHLDYLSGNLDFGDDYDYLIVVERREKDDIDDCYYYALKTKIQD